MMSGALFLNRAHQVKTIFSKYIFRLVTAFAFWSSIYALDLGGEKKTILLNTIKGSYHMWFIPTIIGLYICIPIISKFIESDRIAKYFMTVSFITAFLSPQIVQLTNDFGGEILKEIITAFNITLKSMNLHLVLGFTFYFIGGFYLNKIHLNKKIRFAIYVGGIIGFAATILLNAVLAVKTQLPVGTYYDNFTINVLLESLAVFVWFKYNSPNKKLLNTIMSKLAKYSFGAYLMHVLIITKLNSIFGLNSLSFYPIISVPIISILIFVLSFAISGVINKIPFLKKYIV